MRTVRSNAKVDLLLEAVCLEGLSDAENGIRRPLLNVSPCRCSPSCKVGCCWQRARCERPSLTGGQSSAGEHGEEM